jgi:predicted solute-binding protein
VAVVTIRIGHSADPDDAFMIWALEAGAVDTRGLELEPVVSDIQTLNDWALEGRLEVTAVSAGAYPSVRATAPSSSRTKRSRSTTCAGSRSSRRAR